MGSAACLGDPLAKSSEGKEAILTQVFTQLEVIRRRRSRITTVAPVTAALLFVSVAGGYATTQHPPNPTSITVRDPRVVILKARRVLHLFDGDELVRVYPMDLGVAPKGQKRRKGDGRTPVGRFRVVLKNPRSAYHRFVGIDYPNQKAVSYGLANGLISPGAADSLRGALADGRCPDWGTDLGGGVGIHGGRRGRDWTAGCVAVSDDHMAELFDVLRVGDPVEILP